MTVAAAKGDGGGIGSCHARRRAVAVLVAKVDRRAPEDGWRLRPTKWRAVLAVGGRALNCRRDRHLSTRRSPAAAIATATAGDDAVARSVAYGEATWAVVDGDDIPLVVVNSAMVAEAGLSAAKARRWRSVECRARLAVDSKMY